MPSTTTSPNMNLSVPIVSVTPGPEWASDYNACLSIIDQHNHSSGSGVQITQDGINISSIATSLNSLSFNGTNAFNLRSVKFTAQGAALALVTDVGCLYEAGVDLYYNDGAGNQIRLTQGGSIVGTAGSITGLPSGTASAAYVAGTFVWQSATATAANMDAGSYVFRNATASSKGLTLSPPNAMAANYGLTLPALPASTNIMALDTSGNITAPYSVDNSTIVITSNVIKVASQGITATQIASGAVGSNQIALGAVTNAELASNAVITVKILDGAVTNSKLAALGQQVSSSCGSFFTSSTSFVAVTNLTVTITTVGRPVFITLMPDGSGAAAGIVPTTADAVLQFLRGGVSISKISFTGTLGTQPLIYIDVVGAGTYTYTVEVVVASGNFSVDNIVLIAYEL